MYKREAEVKEYQEKVVQIRRVTKVVKGGKKMGFRAAVVVGNQTGSVGFGLGKSAEVSAAIRKAVEAAKRRLITIKMIGTTIPHDVIGKMGSSRVLIRPTKKGTGVIAGGAIRSVLELVGIKDVVAKSLGSPNSINTARATINALLALRTKADEEELRGIPVEVYYIQKEG